ncbi:hypothetical protein BpHYR1_031969 [Brachionus plicatilis]|uniref:Uncharacterized protein n=1 Tax=Brachionus plicatilis TaxID=10195 RepID=A0A3M7SNS7_BRAPC|nr:hypothetical protein BpHYR1_031969 [Brachionus plicatilis]
MEQDFWINVDVTFNSFIMSTNKSLTARQQLCVSLSFLDKSCEFSLFMKSLTKISLPNDRQKLSTYSTVNWAKISTWNGRKFIFNFNIQELKIDNEI